MMAECGISYASLNASYVDDVDGELRLVPVQLGYNDK